MAAQENLAKTFRRLVLSSYRIRENMWWACYRLASEEAKALNDKVESISKEKNKSDGKLTNANSRIRKLCDELKEEKQMNENLMHNQKAWQTKYDVMQKKMEDDCKKKDKEINELQVCEYKIQKISFFPN